MFLYYLIIAPIEMIVEVVFYFFLKINIGGVISAIMGVSIVINFLALPLYNIADALQDKERQISRRLEPRLKRIRKAFKGDEQFMMISTYYRQNDYHPLYVLRSSLSILIEIPFFIAAYHFLSHCPLLLGEHFWIFKDLGSPDRMWTLSLDALSLPINILPIIMTLINVVSAAVYTRGGTIKEKVQIYALAAIFLVLLYESPSGLVIYWILNNLFSLFKNIIQKMKHPQTILSYILAACFLTLSVLFFIIVKQAKITEKLFIGLLGIFFLFLPTIATKFVQTQAYKTFTDKISVLTKKSKSDFFIFIFSALGLATLLGFLLPINVIATSPIEFSSLGKTPSPLYYIYSSFWSFLGMCVFWPTCIYFMFGGKVKSILTILFPALLVCALCNVYIFKPDYGNLNAMFLLAQGNRRMGVPQYYGIISMLIMFIIICIYFILRKHHKSVLLSVALFSICLGMFALGTFKTGFIRQEYSAYRKAKQLSDTVADTQKITPVYHLSKDKQNVVILFLDRAVSSWLPCMIKEFPDLSDRFDGFTYYPNTVSHGTCTNTGVPSMVAGYEYVPDKINERNKELLVNKHNEACLVMPKIFSDAGFDVTVTDIPWLNYLVEGDLSVFDVLPDVHAYNIIGKQLSHYYLNTKTEESQRQTDQDKICINKIRYFSLLQSLMPTLRERFYTVAFYNLTFISGMTFLQNFSHLYSLRELTDFNNDKMTYTFITNNTTHEASFLNVPQYDTVINEADADFSDYQFGYKMHNNNLTDIYQANTSAILQVAKWLDYLKENNVYDNTRIIIVADHGRDLPLDDLFPLFSGSNISVEIPTLSNPLFMIKDFNCRGSLQINNAFMSNADTILFAIKNLPISDINPFTGKKFEANKSNGITIHNDWQWNASVQKQRTTFLYDMEEGYIVRDNLFDPKNWTKLSHNK